MSDEERARLGKALEPDVVALRARRAQRPGAQRDFAFNVLALANGEGKDSARAALERRGVLEAAAAYLGAPVILKGWALQINDADDHAVTHIFEDLGLPDPATVSMHVDSVYRTLKCLVYLGEVKPENGPFRYVRGSHRVARSAFEDAVRLSNDRILGHATAPADRRYVCGLPPPFRLKGQFGNDLQDHEPIVAELLRSDWPVTSDYGDVIFFDNRGFHRGALIARGERQVLQVTLRPA